MIKARKSIFSTIFSLFISIFQFVFQFVLIYLLIDHYGTEFSGFNRINTTILSFVGSTDGGIGVMTVLFLIKPILNNDYYRVNDILLTARKNYRKLFFITLLLILLITLGMIFYYDFFKKENTIHLSNGKSIANLEMIFIILSISSKNLLSLLWVAPYENLLQADQNNYINRLIVLITDLLFYSLLFYLISILNDPTYVFIFFIFYSLFKSFLIKIYVKIKYPWIDFNKGEIEERLNLKTRHISLYKISIAFFYNLDLIFAAILISFDSVAFISLYLIVVSAFRNIANSLIYSFKEYFAAITNQEGRVYWNDYQKLERYTIWASSIFFIIQFLLSPYISIALFSNLIEKDNQSYMFFEHLFTHQTFAIITAVETFIFLLSQPHNIMIYSKKYFNRISFKTFIISIIAIITSFSVGEITKHLLHSSAEVIFYSFSTTFIIFMIIHYIYLYYYSWSKLTYNSNLKDIFRNLPIIFLPILFAFIFKNYYLNNNPNWTLSLINPDKKIYWQQLNHLLWLSFICSMYSILTVSLNILIFLPYWFIHLISDSIVKKLKKVKSKAKTNDLFLHDGDGVYYKINTKDDDLDTNKQVYILDSKIKVKKTKLKKEL